MAETIFEKYDTSELNVAIGLAARLQADTVTKGGMLHVTLPGSTETVDLKVLEIGKIDPDILRPDQMTDPATQDRSPMPGMLVDLGPLFGETEDDGVYQNTVSVTFDPDPAHKIPAASKETLERYKVGAANQEAYQEKFGGTEIFRMNLKFLHGMQPPEVLPVTATELSAVGMNAAAAELESAAPVNRDPVPVPSTAPRN